MLGEGHVMSCDALGLGESWASWEIEVLDGTIESRLRRERTGPARGRTQASLRTVSSLSVSFLTQAQQPRTTLCTQASGLRDEQVNVWVLRAHPLSSPPKISPSDTHSIHCSHMQCSF